MRISVVRIPFFKLTERKENKMSKQMKSAYSALRMKDTLIAVLESFKPTMLALCAIALMFCNTGLFVILSVVAALSVAAWIAVRLLAVVLNWRMRLLGFDEIELERLALA